MTPAATKLFGSALPNTSSSSLLVAVLVQQQVERFSGGRDCSSRHAAALAKRAVSPLAAPAATCCCVAAAPSAGAALTAASSGARWRHHERGVTVSEPHASSTQRTRPQRASARAQLNAGFPSRALTVLCARHIHADRSARERELGGSALCVCRRMRSLSSTHSHESRCAQNTTQATRAHRTSSAKWAAHSRQGNRRLRIRTCARPHLRERQAGRARRRSRVDAPARTRHAAAAW